MPIVGGTSSLNISDWSHSTVYTTFNETLSTLDAQRIPPLTTVWTPPPQCANRWIRGTFVTFITTVAAATGPAKVQQTPAQVGDSSASPTSSFLPGSSIVARQVDGESMRIVYSTDPGNPTPGATYPWDTLYTSCQPYSLRPTYSPGICPEGQTILEVTESQFKGSTGGVATIWRASCCRIGMSWDPDWPKTCVSNFSEPFRALAELTVTETGFSSATTISTVYEWVTSSLVGGSITGTYSTSTMSNITTLTRGIALADPVVVAWEFDDLTLFPTNYASSLAQKIGVTMSGSPTPASTSRLPQETSQSPTPKANGLGTGAKAGIAVAAIAGAVIFGAALILWHLRKRRRSRGEAEPSGTTGEDIAEMEGGGRNLDIRRWFLNGTSRKELPVKERPLELDSKAVNIVPGHPVELDASEPRIPETVRAESTEVEGIGSGTHTQETIRPDSTEVEGTRSDTQIGETVPSVSTEVKGTR